MSIGPLPPPPPPTFKRPEIPTPPPNPENTATPAARLQAKGGRAFNSGTLWVARLGKQQEVGKTENEAAGKLLARLA